MSDPGILFLLAAGVVMSVGFVADSRETPPPHAPLQSRIDAAARAQEARQVRAAATAPSQPSGQDLKVAAQASKVEMEAMAEMREQDGMKLKVCENCGSVHGLEKIQVEMAGKESTGQS